MFIPPSQILQSFVQSTAQTALYSGKQLYHFAKGVESVTGMDIDAMVDGNPWVPSVAQNAYCMARDTFRPATELTMQGRKIHIKGTWHVGPLFKQQRLNAMNRGVQGERAVFLEGLERNSEAESANVNYFLGHSNSNQLMGIENLDLSFLNVSLDMLDNLYDIEIIRKQIDSPDSYRTSLDLKLFIFNLKIEFVNMLVIWTRSKKLPLSVILRSFLNTGSKMYEFVRSLEMYLEAQIDPDSIIEAMPVDLRVWEELCIIIIKITGEKIITQFDLPLKTLVQAIDDADEKSTERARNEIRIDWRNKLWAMTVTHTVPLLPPGLDVELLVGEDHRSGLIEIFRGNLGPQVLFLIDQKAPLPSRTKLKSIREMLDGLQEIDSE